MEIRNKMLIFADNENINMISLLRMERKKKKYEKPAMQVYELQRYAPIVCTSGDPTAPIVPGGWPGGVPW